MKWSAMHQPEAGPEIGAVAESLHRGALLLLRDLRLADAESGLGPARLSALSVLVFGGPRSLGELAAAEQVTPPTMTRVVQGLEAQGLVARRPDPADGRRVVLRATPRGRRSMLAARERRLKRLRAKLARLSKRDLGLLSRAAERIEILSR